MLACVWNRWGEGEREESLDEQRTEKVARSEGSGGLVLLLMTNRGWFR